MAVKYRPRFQTYQVMYRDGKKVTYLKDVVLGKPLKTGPLPVLNFRDKRSAVAVDELIKFIRKGGYKKADSKLVREWTMQPQWLFFVVRRRIAKTATQKTRARRFWAKVCD